MKRQVYIHARSVRRCECELVVLKLSKFRKVSARWIPKQLLNKQMEKVVEVCTRHFLKSRFAPM
jgi:hypothetical protein